MENIFQTLWSTLTEFALTSGVRLIGALLLIILGFKLSNWLIKKLRNNKKLGHIDAGARSFLFSFIAIAIKILLVISAAAIIGIPMTSMIAVLGSAGLAIGLALQGSLSNLAGGLMILIFTPFHVGDYITSGSVSGTVESISILYTKLITPDNCSITVPNSMLSNDVVTNYSSENTRRVDLTFSVGYNSNSEQVRSLLLDMAAKDERVMQDPAPVVFMTAHGDSSLQFSLRVWCAGSDYWSVKFDFTEKAKKLFDENGIQIPFPQMDVHITQ